MQAQLSAAAAQLQAAHSQSHISSGQQQSMPMVPPMAPTRRSSFRIASGGDSMSKSDNTTSPERSNPGLVVDEERKMRRRGSQLYVSAGYFPF